MRGKKNNIFIFASLVILAFFLAFNFSSAFTGIEKQALIESLIKQVAILKEKLLEIQKQLLVLISNQARQIQPQDKKIIFNVPAVSDSELNINTDGAASEEEYYNSFSESLSKIGFTNEEFNGLKKDKNSRPYSLEELSQQAVFGADLRELKPSFQAWHNLDEKVSDALKKIAVSQQMLSFHRSMVVWYKYHSQLAQKLGDENLPASEINDLYNQYLENAKIYLPKSQELLSKSENPRFFGLFSFVKIAYSSGFYHFGGMVLSWADTCTNGAAISVGPPRGGLLWIYYSVWAANPYLWKNLSPGAYILGRALYGPGVCNKGHVSYPIGTAQILYFGSSPL